MHTTAGSVIIDFRYPFDPNKPCGLESTKRWFGIHTCFRRRALPQKVEREWKTTTCHENHQCFPVAIACACRVMERRPLLFRPIGDYLSMQVPDRSEYVGTIESISEFTRRKRRWNKEVSWAPGTVHSGSKDVVLLCGLSTGAGRISPITAAKADVRVSSFETIFAAF